ncbi:MAG: S-layer homology domain-containing protein, partial [Clostridia bacterium]|nr:S-layer homology domain-containing protein [Clostridia bacterium]
MRTVAKFVAVIFAVMLVGVAIPSESSVNPFVDVELNHWAYDAVSQLNARGIVTGYEDGMFRGNKAASRYEVASVVARMLAFVDVNKASKQDVEILKQLAFEFHNELKLLGVKNEQLDS